MNGLPPFRAYLERDYRMDEMRLVIRERRAGDARYLMRDGTWRAFTPDQLAEATVPSDEFGILLPVESIEAIAWAFDEHLGTAMHGRTEAAVLREWLTVERDRVDAILRGRSE
jgi:hypothetical protein